MKRRSLMIIVLIALFILIVITLYRFVDNLGQSYQQLGLIQDKKPVVVYTTGLVKQLKSESFVSCSLI